MQLVTVVNPPEKHVREETEQDVSIMPRTTETNTQIPHENVDISTMLRGSTARLSGAYM